MGVVIYVLAFLFVVIAINWAKIKSYVYDRVIVDMTFVWYQEVISLLPHSSIILDVGIGTGSALIRNEDLVNEKALRVTGLDYDKEYIVACKENIAKSKLSKCCEIVHASIYDYHGGPFDAVYFSGSLMIMPDKVGALKHVRTLLKPKGCIYVTQTFEKSQNVWMEKIKPFLKYIISIDFGSVTYEKEFLEVVQKSGLEVDSTKTISDTANRAAKLLKYSLIVMQCFYENTRYDMMNVLEHSK